MTSVAPGDLSAMALNCTLKRGGGESSTQLVVDLILDELAKHKVSGDSARAVDHAILPGVAFDEGEGDDWPGLRQRVLDADILVLATPIWLGNPSSVCQRVLERMDAFLGEEDERGRMIAWDKVAIVGVVGNEDGAHNVGAVLFQGLNDVGFTVPASGMAYWVGEDGLGRLRRPARRARAGARRRGRRGRQRRPSRGPAASYALPGRMTGLGTEIRPLDEWLLRDLLAHEDRIGAVSIYCAGAGGEEGGPSAAHELLALETARLRARGHAQVADAAERAGTRLMSRFAQVPRRTDASWHALFAGLSGDWWHHQPMPVGMPTLAAVGRRPFVRPLIAAIEDGRPAGALLVGARALRCHEWRMGAIRELALAGPRDGESLVARLGRLAGERGWSEVVLAGQPRLTAAFEALATHGLVVADVDGALDGCAGAGLAAGIGRELAQLRASARVGAVADAIEAAGANGGRVAVGAEEVLAALRHEQVETLMFDNDRSLAGVWLPGGRLARSAPGPDARPEPMLLERMIERAIAGRARLLPLRAAEAEPLSAVEGVAAELRW